MSARLLSGSAWHMSAVARHPVALRFALAEAWRRWTTRRLLADLDDRLLKDIGATRSDAHFEAAKPFWRG